MKCCNVDDVKVHVHVKRKQALLTRVVVNVKQHSLKSL